MSTPKPSGKVSQHPTDRPVPIPVSPANSQSQRVWDPKQHDAHGWYSAEQSEQVEA